MLTFTYLTDYLFEFFAEVSSKDNYDIHELDIFREKYDRCDVAHSQALK